MKIAVVYNRDSQAVINLFGVPNRERYGLKTIRKVREALRAGGHQVKVFEGDKHLVENLEEFMPAVIAGERPGLVFNLSYGIQGRARYTHVPAMLEMLGIPYVGSSPETHAIALDKVVTKMILIQRGLPTPRFAVLDEPHSELSEDLKYPLIVKPKDEAVSFGLRIVGNEQELREGVTAIYEKFKAPTLVEEYIDGREINVALLGNDPVEALPPVELTFTEGPAIYTYEDKTHRSKREIVPVCPAALTREETERVQSLAIDTFKALGCFDSARVDFRRDKKGNFFILEVNSMASLGPGGSFVFAASKIGIDYNALANRFVEIAGKRYFGPGFTSHVSRKSGSKEQSIFTYLTHNRDRLEDKLRVWTEMQSMTGDSAGISEVSRTLNERLSGLGLVQLHEYTNMTSTWGWQTPAGLENGTLLVVALDVPRVTGGYPHRFRREPEWLYGEGIALTRAGIVSMLNAFEALRSVKKLQNTRLGVFAYADEGEQMRQSRHMLKEIAAKAKQVIVLRPGNRVGKAITQRRGIRKLNVIAEGKPLRIGHRGTEVEALSWFIKRAGEVQGLSRPGQKLTVSVHEMNTDRFGVLLPHRISATVSVTYLNAKLADKAEIAIRDLLLAKAKGVRVRVETVSDRPPLLRKKNNRPLISRIKGICREWNLPFEEDASLLPSAAGEVPPDIPVVCGLAPASRDMFTPFEAIHRGEFLQRTLLLALFLVEG